MTPLYGNSDRKFEKTGRLFRYEKIENVNIALAGANKIRIKLTNINAMVMQLMSASLVACFECMREWNVGKRVERRNVSMVCDITPSLGLDTELDGRAGGCSHPCKSAAHEPTSLTGPAREVRGKDGQYIVSSPASLLQVVAAY